jgi:hypothetical protein
MSKDPIKTDNSHYAEKLQLRLDNLPGGKELTVLDCFAGQGLLWKEIRLQRSDRLFNIVSIDKKPTDAGSIHLVGDNVKFLAAIDLRRFDVIDLDAYGVPYEQLRLILTRPTKPGTVLYVTFIQSMFGQLPPAMLADLGFTPAMLSKTQMVFRTSGREKLFSWLSIHGIRRVKYYGSPVQGHQSKTYLATILP